MASTPSNPSTSRLGQLDAVSVSAWFSGRLVLRDVSLALPAGFSFTGPAVIEEPNSTILIHPGDKVTVTKTGHLIVDIHFPESAS